MKTNKKTINNHLVKMNKGRYFMKPPTHEYRKKKPFIQMEI